MKSRLVWAGALIVCLLCFGVGCDDIYERAEDPGLKPQKSSGKTEKDEEPKEMSVQQMKKIQYFIVNTRKELRNYANQLKKAEEEAAEDYRLKLSVFEVQQSTWIRKLTVRAEWLEDAKKPDDPDYPAYTLLHAVRLLIREIKLYYHSFEHKHASFAPEVDKKLLDTLDKARFQIQKLEEKQKQESEQN